MNGGFKSQCFIFIVSLKMLIGSFSAYATPEENKPKTVLSETTGFVTTSLATKAVGIVAAYLTTNSLIRFFFPEPSFNQIVLSTLCFCGLNTLYRYNKKYWDDTCKGWNNELGLEASATTASSYLRFTANLLPSFLSNSSFETLCSAGLCATLGYAYSKQF